MKITLQAVVFCIAASTAMAAFKEHAPVAPAQKPADGVRKAPLPAPHPLPADEKELQSFLVGTIWAVEAKPETSHTFLADGHFQGLKHSPAYTITGRRTLTIHWSETTNIPCLFTDDFSVLFELGGKRNIWVRMK